MGSANSTISAEPVLAAVAVAGVLGYGYVQYLQHTGGTVTDTNVNVGLLGLSKGSAVLHGQKKRGRKLQLPGDATLKNLDFLDSSAALLPPRQQQQTALRPQQDDTVPGGFGGADTSGDALGAPGSAAPSSQQQQQQQSEQSAGVKKPKKKRGKKTASDPSSTSADAGATSAPAGKAEKAQASAAVAWADTQDERWTRVEARKKKAVSTQDGLSKLQTTVAAADATTSDAVTTSVTGNSSPVTERTTEDELPSGLDESTLELSVASSPDAPPRVAPVRPLPGEQPAKGFAWEDYEGVQVDGDASSEDDGGWGVVRSRRRPVKTESGSTITTTTAPQLQTKKQRQNAQKREALKEAKRERDTQQQAALASHKRELEGVRRVDQAATPSKRTGSRYDSLDLH
ncbi:hypothetical protein EDB92DRAFT_1829551 [Lactarius akahatsu]|uniref:Uncharacterized protein n=1 Tax=Lactarius akahatsu TaxID=416441 RepID=A0AAD4QHH8_9AGAM|nr:hypothetical protein EDB92DRAFT_1829551 [Lactarius akahatsu]